MVSFNYNGVGFGYPGQAPILCGIHLEIKQGERILLIGPNGSGKSTFALLTAGILAPTSGEYSRSGDGHQTGRTGIVFQNSSAQVIGSSVEEDLAFGLSLLKLSSAEIRLRVDRFLSLFGLETKRHHTPHQLSGGELRRLALAAVLITEPELLILDEPLTMMDAANQVIILNFIQTMIPATTTVIWVDHDLRRARFFKKWYLLDQGGIEPLSFTDLNNAQFLMTKKLAPTPLQELEWRFPGKVTKAILGPELIEFC